MTRRQSASTGKPVPCDSHRLDFHSELFDAVADLVNVDA